MSLYGKCAVIKRTHKNEEEKKNDIARTAEELIKSIDTKGLNVAWNTLKLIIKERGDEPLDPFNSYREDDESEPGPYITIGIKVEAEEK